MILNFEFYLTAVTILAGIVCLADIFFLGKERRAREKEVREREPRLTKEALRERVHLPFIIDYAYAFFPVLFLVLLLRSFLGEPFRIPSASLEPTLHVGDFIFVNKYQYGLRLPVWHKKIYALSAPKRGEIAVFRWPLDESIHYIKRIVGVPGDKLSYINKTLYVNGKAAGQVSKGTSFEPSLMCVVDLKEENLSGIKHAIYLCPQINTANLYNITVPPGMYFGMGDNRDDSSDSRTWGFIPDANLVGKAEFVWLSWVGFDNFSWKHPFSIIRWSRFGTRIV